MLALTTLDCGNYVSPSAERSWQGETTDVARALFRASPSSSSINQLYLPYISSGYESGSQGILIEKALFARHFAQIIPYFCIRLMPRLYSYCDSLVSHSAPLPLSQWANLIYGDNRPRLSFARPSWSLETIGLESPLQDLPASITIRNGPRNVLHTWISRALGLSERNQIQAIPTVLKR